MDEIYDKAFEFGSIYESILECSKGVKWKDSVLENFLHPCRAACTIMESLEKNDFSYKPLPYHKFFVKEPKEREIYSTRFRDRVIQRSMLNSGLYHLLTRRLIYDNFACQKGKGTDLAIRRLKKHLNDYYRKYGNIGYVCQIDIRKFFPSIPHSIAKQALQRCITNNPKSLKFCFDIIDFFEDQSQKYGYDSSFGKRGIAPGSEFSQLVALNVLDLIDHYAKDKLGIKHYIRYMDDIVFFHNDCEFVKKTFYEIKTMIEKMGLIINKKSGIRPLKNGISFLKFNFKFNKIGKLIVKINDNSKRRERRKLRAYRSMLDENKIDIGLVYSNLMSWSDHIKYASSKSLVKNIHEFANRLFGTYFFLGRNKYQSLMRKRHIHYIK